MFQLVVQEKNGGSEQRLSFEKEEVTIGRIQGNDIVLPKGNVSKRHARFVAKDGRLLIVDLKSTNGTYVNGRRITSPASVGEGDKVYVGDFCLILESITGSEVDRRSSIPAPPPMSDQIYGESRAISQVPSRPTSHGPEVSISESPAPPLTPPPLQVGLPQAQYSSMPPQRGGATVAPKLSSIDAGLKQDPGLAFDGVTSDFEQLKPAQGFGKDATSHGRDRFPVRQDFVPTPGSPAASDVPTAVRYVMAHLSKVFDIENVDPYALENENRWAEAEVEVGQIVQRLRADHLIASTVSLDAVAQWAVREAVTFGPLDSYLADENVQELTVLGLEWMEIAKGFEKETISGSFSSIHALHIAIARLFAQSGDVYDAARSTQSTTLFDGTYVRVIGSDRSARGPMLEIRRPSTPLTLAQLESQQIISDTAARWLERAIRDGRTGLVLGASDLAVNVLMEALGNAIDVQEKLLTLEGLPRISLDRTRSVALTGAGEALWQLAAQLPSDRWLLRLEVVQPSAGLLAALAARSDGSIAGAKAANLDAGIGRIKAALGGAERLVGTAFSYVLFVDHPSGDSPKLVRLAELSTSGETLQVKNISV